MYMHWFTYVFELVDCNSWCLLVLLSAQHMLESLPLAAPPKPRDLSPEELALLEEKEELTLMELRIFLRDVLNKLGTDKKFSIFAKPVNIEDVCIFYFFFFFFKLPAYQKMVLVKFREARSLILVEFFF